MTRELFAGGAPWEPVVGYSRVVRVGPFVYVAGTTATDGAGAVAFPDDAYRQAKQALANVEQALLRAGARLDDVVRTRIYVTDIGRWEEIGRAHGDVFGAIRPAATMVEVAALVDSAMLVEIEADAVVAEQAKSRSERG